uniref:Pentatricopeptide repeat-containing protein n=1 Tax=Nelumbo nucifera TaxID=4432 RepID=A0A822XNL6_NELNU|nr:TPA_asm: hypothetical protein HUJ06_022756 [Nelumbo nucifera]
MIAGYVLSGSNDQALEMFEEMRRAGEQPDEVTMLSLLSACADSGALEAGKQIHSSLLEMGSGLSIVLGNALIDMYAKCGSIEKALDVFRGMTEKDVSTWNSIIGGLVFHGHAEQSICLFKEMLREKIKSGQMRSLLLVSWLPVVMVGWLMRSRRYFNLMRIQYGIEPNIKHYGCMVDMLGRRGLLDEAFKFVEVMDVEPNAIIWRTLLGACGTHGNIELGERANERLLAMRRDQSGDYVLLSNIYASMGEWDGVEKVRKLMDDSGVKKEPGCSLIEADHKDLMIFLFESKPSLNPSLISLCKKTVQANALQTRKTMLFDYSM